MTTSPIAGPNLNVGRVAPARDLLAVETMARHQDVREGIRWLRGEQVPLTVLFVSHRWETVESPDPSGNQWRAIQQFLRLICVAVESVLTPIPERLQLIPSLTAEGALQAQEIARRILGFGPFATGPQNKTMVLAAFDRLQRNRALFHDWLAERIGVWVDYTCMPQRPLADDEALEFQRTLRALDKLVASSTVVALRTPADEYPQRGWCAMEAFLGSSRSFERMLFLDADRLKEGQDVAIPTRPNQGTDSGEAAEIMGDSYDQDLAAFNDTCRQWTSVEAPLVHSWVPDAWPKYRALQGSGFFSSEFDPNPFRRALDAIRDLETLLVERWLMNDQELKLDLGAEVVRIMEASGLHCSERTDLLYVGLLLAANGWIDAFKPLFRDALNLYVDRALKLGTTPGAPEGGRVPSLNVALHPIDTDARKLFTMVAPSSPGTWNSRLSSLHSSRPAERPIVDRLLLEFSKHPAKYVFVG